MPILGAGVAGAVFRGTVNIEQSAILPATGDPVRL